MFHINVSTIKYMNQGTNVFYGFESPDGRIRSRVTDFKFWPLCQNQMEANRYCWVESSFFCLCDKKQKSKFWEITRDVQGFNVKPWWLEFGSVCGRPQHYTPSTVFQSCFSRHTFVSHLSKGTDGAIPVCPVWTLCPGSQFLHITAL